MPDISFEARLGVGVPVPGFRCASPGVTKTGAAPDGAPEDYRAVNYPRCQHCMQRERETESFGGENVIAPRWETVCANKIVAIPDGDLQNHRVVCYQIKDCVVTACAIF